jgi:hypothetical protein
MLALVVLASAVLLVAVWVKFVAFAPAAADAIVATSAYDRAAIPASLGIVVLLQFLFAWLARTPISEQIPSRIASSTRNVWKRVWVRLFVSFCWTLTLAIFLFVILVFVSDV